MVKESKECMSCIHFLSTTMNHEVIKIQALTTLFTRVEVGQRRAIRKLQVPFVSFLRNDFSVMGTAATFGSFILPRLVEGIVGDCDIGC